MLWVAQGLSDGSVWLIHQHEVKAVVTLARCPQYIEYLARRRGADVREHRPEVVNRNHNRSGGQHRDEVERSAQQYESFALADAKCLRIDAPVAERPPHSETRRAGRRSDALPPRECVRHESCDGCVRDSHCEIERIRADSSIHCYEPLAACVQSGR
jgi:hypothetical protein